MKNPLKKLFHDITLRNSQTIHKGTNRTNRKSLQQLVFEDAEIQGVCENIIF